MKKYFIKGAFALGGLFAGLFLAGYSKAKTPQAVAAATSTENTATADV